MFVDDFIPHWISPDGIAYEIGERVPVCRIADAILFNERIGIATCDACDFVAVAPMTALWRAVYAHQQAHLMTGDGQDEDGEPPSFMLDDEGPNGPQHPDFKP
jgi:hypothetical protein